MISIVYKNGTSIECETIQKMPRNDVMEVKMVAADGKELEAIGSQFKYIPGPNGLLQVVEPVAWFGDHAKFIVANLK